uniref:SCP domain-containing protein n=1 Tax=Oryza brachyantha TaxID=4533 RepID=J3MIB9_ORYBR
MEAPNKKAVLISLMIAIGVFATSSMAQVTQQDLVDLHNVVRADVGVGPVTWDDTVAAYAQAYAKDRRGDCKLQHSNSGGKYGENLFRGSPTPAGSTARTCSGAPPAPTRRRPTWWAPGWRRRSGTTT